MDLIDEGDSGQQCGVRFINANGKEWANGAEMKGRKGEALVGLAMAMAVAVAVAVGVLAVL